jgi:hypothetical protein
VIDKPKEFINNYPDSFPPTVISTIYPEKLTKKEILYMALGRTLPKILRNAY